MKVKWPRKRRLTSWDCINFGAGDEVNYLHRGCGFIANGGTAINCCFVGCPVLFLQIHHYGGFEPHQLLVTGGKALRLKTKLRQGFLYVFKRGA
jgi:hypothetical protein